MKTKPQIRFAQKGDLDEIISMCAAHAAFEQTHYDKPGKFERLSRDLFECNPKLFCLVIDSGTELIGYATYMLQYATWEASEYIYMDCLFIKDFARSNGFGEALVKKIQEEATKMNCRAIQWQTPDFNARAIKFYRRIGASSKMKQRFYLGFQ